MAGATYAAVVYAISSLSIVFANKFIMQVLYHPFALLLGQVVVTIVFSLIALFFSMRNCCKFMLDKRHVKWFALIGFSSFVGWSASLEGLKSGSVATLTMIKGVNPLLAAFLANLSLPPSQQNQHNGHLGWVAFAAVGCCFYTYDSASADIRACLFFLMSVLSASVNAVSFQRMQLHSPLPCDTLSSVLYSSVFINAAALPFVLVAFLDTVSSDAIVQV
jgi:uncharacterized membrane protein